MSENLIQRLQVKNRRADQFVDEPNQYKRDQRRADMQELRTLNQLLNKRRAELKLDEKPGKVEPKQKSGSLPSVKINVKDDSRKRNVSSSPMRFEQEICEQCADEVYASFTPRSTSVTEKSARSCSQTEVNASESSDSNVDLKGNDFQSFRSKTDISGRLTWSQKDRFYSHDGIRVTICKSNEDPNAILYCLKMKGGKRVLLQRTSSEMILASFENDSTRYIACNLDLV
ncbi:hypothetical protein M3Y97_00445500 [Aphelenchoides bicaudatus]|nr:hypothetical protein M3Y97_00445500 [Aphelenchoides bicaudatus]